VLAEALAVGVAVVGVGVGVAVVGVGVGVVGVGVGVAVVGVGVGVAVVGVVDGVVVVDVLAVGVAVVGVADGVAVAEADALTACRGWQDSLIPDAVAADALLFSAATTPPEAAVSSALPAISVTALRRPCAIRDLQLVFIDINVKSVITREAVQFAFSARLGTVRRLVGAKPQI
jgi:hypothetical protein